MKYSIFRVKTLGFPPNRPDPQVRRQNEVLLQSTYLCEFPEEDVDEHLEGVPLSLRRRREAADFLLAMSTGPFCDDRIVHHCRAGCCSSARESKMKLWCAIQADVKSLED